MSKFIRDTAVVPLTPTADHTGSRGYLVELSSGSAAIINAATDLPHGVIVDGQDPTNNANALDSIALLGGNIGTIPLKMAASPGTVVAGTRLISTGDGTSKAAAGNPGEVLVGIALEAGAANEIIEALPLRPVALGGKLTTVGGAASEAFSSLPILAADKVVATISDNLTGDTLDLLEVKQAAGSITLLFSANPGAGVVVSVLVER